MKRLFCCLLVGILLLGLVACSSSAPTTDSTDTSTPTGTTEPADTTADTPSDTADPAEPTITLPLAENLTFSFWTLLNESYCGFYGNLANHPAYIELAERTNVTPEFVHPPESGAQDQFGLIMASGDYYDVMQRTYSTLTEIELVENDIAVDITDYVQTCMPNYYALITADDDIRRDATAENGHVMTIYALDEEPGLNWWGLGLRKDLLDAADVDLPVTYEDWETCLKVFQDAGVERPLSLPQVGYFYSSSFEAGFGVSYSFYQDGDTVKFGPMEDGFLDYLTLMNDWVNKKYISSSFASDEERFAGLPAIGDVINGVVGASVITSSEIGSAYADLSGNPDFYYAGVANPVKSDGSSKTWSTEGGSGRIGSPYMVTTNMDQERLPELLTYFNYVYTEEGAELVSWGVEGDAFVWNENGEREYTSKIDTTAFDNVNTFHVYGLTMFNTPGLYNDKERYLGRPDEIVEMQSNWAAAGTGFGTLPTLSFTAEESEDYSGPANDCATHVAENIAKFIIGTRPLSEFDDFREELRSLGIETVLEIYQAAFDRYYQR